MKTNEPVWVLRPSSECGAVHFTVIWQSTWKQGQHWWRLRTAATIRGSRWTVSVRADLSPRRPLWRRTVARLPSLQSTEGWSCFATRPPPSNNASAKTKIAEFGWRYAMTDPFELGLIQIGKKIIHMQKLRNRRIDAVLNYGISTGQLGKVNSTHLSHVLGNQRTFPNIFFSFKRHSRFEKIEIFMKFCLYKEEPRTTRSKSQTNLWTSFDLLIEQVKDERTFSLVNISSVTDSLALWTSSSANRTWRMMFSSSWSWIDMRHSFS